MKSLIEYLTTPLAERLALTLAHSSWQIAAIALLTFPVLLWMRHSSPNARYILCCGALLLMLAMPVMTFTMLGETSPPYTVPRAQEVIVYPAVEVTSSHSPTIIPSGKPSEIPLVAPVVPATEVAIPNIVTVAPASVPTSETIQRSDAWKSWMTGFWLLGLNLMILRNLGGWLATRRLRSMSVRTTELRASEMLRTLSLKFGLTRVVKLRECARIQTPFMFGWLKPIILTPIGLMSNLTNAQLMALLAHELAHVRRHDYLVNIFQTVIESLLFFHPGVWWLSRRIRLEREFCCDDVAVALTGDRVAYADALAMVEESCERFGMGLAAGQKPLVQRIRRVLGLAPIRSVRGSPFHVSGTGLMLLVMLLAVFLGKEQQALSAAEVSPAIVPYQMIDQLKRQTDEHLKSGRIEAAEDAILLALPSLASAWLGEEMSSLVEYHASEFQSVMKKRPQLEPLLVKRILALDQAPAKTAAMLDIIGKETEALEIYSKLTAEKLPTTVGIRMRVLRLVGSKEPAKLPVLLAGLPETDAVTSAIESAFFATETFDLRIAFINHLSEYMEQAEIQASGGPNWIPRMEVGFNTIVYGAYQMPDIWHPKAAHNNNYKGKPSTPDLIETRRSVFERYCRAALRFPRHASWAFSRLGCLADLRGQFEKNPALAGLARQALETSGEVTRDALVDLKANNPRCYSPELYLALCRWKGASEKFDFAPAINARIESLEKLLSCDAKVFLDLAKPEVTNVLRMPSPAPFVADEFPVEVIYEIWRERRYDVDILRLVVGQVHKEGFCLSYMRTVSNQPGKVAEFLEQLAITQLGPPSERAKVIATLPDKHIIHCWATKPAVVAYVDLLQSMTAEPQLIFPALEKAWELGVMDRMNVSAWLQSEDFTNDPKKVIERLDASPMLGSVAQFRSFSVQSGLQLFAANAPATLADWVIDEINSLPAVAKAPYVAHLKTKNSFGAKLLLAVIEKDGAVACVEVMRSHLSEISGLSAQLKKELAIFVGSKLPTDATVIKDALGQAALDAQAERRNRFKEAFFKPDGLNFGGGPIQEIFLAAYRSNPNDALDLLHLALELAQQPALPGSPLAKYDPSIMSELLGYFPLRQSDTQKATAFYLRVLADPRLGPYVTLDESMLSPAFKSGSGVEVEMAAFKNAMVWLSEIYPENLSEEYLFIATLKRWDHISSKGEAATQTAEFREAVLAALPQARRSIVEAAMILGSHRTHWRYRTGKVPGTESILQPAFAKVSASIVNEQLPLNVRLAMAVAICRNCGIHLPPSLRVQGAELLASAWENQRWIGGSTPMEQSQEVWILRAFYDLESGEQRDAVARRLVAAWKKHFDKLDSANSLQLNEDGALWMVGLTAQVGDEATLAHAMSGAVGNVLSVSPVLSLRLLIRAGKVDAAATLFPRCLDQLSNRAHHQDMFLDRALLDHMPAFLVKIENAEARLLAECHLHGLESWPFDASLPTREARLLEIAVRADALKFQQPQIQQTVFQLIAQEPATSSLLYEGLIKAAKLDQLDAIMDSNESFAWVNLAQKMMSSVVTAGKVDRALAILRQIQQTSTVGARKYARVWSALSEGVQTGVSGVQQDSTKLSSMFPVTCFMASLPPQLGLSDEDRAGNYARNIYWHALTDRMPAWKIWHEGLDSKVREELDAFWYAHSGWAIGLTANRIPKGESLEIRLNLMKRILSQPEIVGPTGALHDDAIGKLRNSEIFSLDELLEIGPQLATAMPDPNPAWKSLIQAAEKAGNTSKAAEFRTHLKEAP